MTTRSLLERASAPATLLVIAVLVRLLFVLSMGDRMYFADTAEYEAAALRLLHGEPTAEGGPRAPLYPALMAFGFLLGGEGDYRSVRLLQVVLAALVVWGTGRLARALGGAAAERLALLFTAFSPLLVFASGLLYPTTLHTLLLLGFTAAVIAARERPSWLASLAAGVLLAGGILTDPVFVAPAAALLAWSLIASRHRGWSSLRGAVVTGVVAVAVLAPWLQATRARAESGGAFMQKAQYVLDWSRSDPRMASQRRVRLPADTEFRPLSAGDFARRELGLLREQPVAYLSDVAGEFLHFFAPMPDRIQTQNRYNRGPVLWVGAIHFVPLLLLAIAGLWRGAGARAPRVALALVVIATAGFYAFFFTQTRYRIPVEPMFAVLAALALCGIAPRLTRVLAGEDAASPPVPPRRS